jgi:hypothetical protein
LLLVLSGEAINTYFIVFGYTQQGIELIIYITQSEHANHYTADSEVNTRELKYSRKLCKNQKIMNSTFILFNLTVTLID